jgi:hypothetical protein
MARKSLGRGAVIGQTEGVKEAGGIEVGAQFASGQQAAAPDRTPERPEAVDTLHRWTE